MQDSEQTERVENLHITGATLMSPTLRLTVPRARVADVQNLLVLEAAGFLPKGRVQFDPHEQAFVVDLEVDAVSHLLELLMIATTWSERQAREGPQLHLSFPDPVGGWIRKTRAELNR